MGTKRLLTVAGVTSFVIFFVVMLLFQVGADEKLIETFIPRVEDRLGVKISYGALDASLSSLSIEKIEVRSKDTAQLFATADEAVLSVRVGPLFFGEIDLTGVRVEGLALSLGEQAGGAGLRKWRELIAAVTGRMSGQGAGEKTTKGSGSSLPEITVKRASIHGVLGNFELSAEDLDGRFVAEGRVLGKSGEYTLSHAKDVLLSGSGAVLDWKRRTSAAQLELGRSKIFLPGEKDGVSTLWTDLLEAKRLLRPEERGASQEVEEQQRKQEPGKGLSSLLGEVGVHMEDGSVLLRGAQISSKRPLISAGTVDGRWSRGEGLSLRASGAFLSTEGAHKVTVALRSGGEDSLNLVLEAPSIPLKRLGELVSLPEEIDAGQAKASLSVTVAQEPSSELLRAQGQVGVTSLIIDHPRISRAPIVDLDGRADFDFLFDDRLDTVRIERLELARDMFRMTVKGEARLDRLAFDLGISVPPTPCRQVYAAVPEPLRRRLAGVVLDGRFGLEMHLALDKETPDAVLLDIDLHNDCRIAELGTIPDAPFFKGPFAYMAYDEDAEDLRLVTGPGTQRWTPLGLISPFVIEALLTTEDGKFWRHKGVTIPEIRRAIALNLKEGSVSHGASTLTMQLAKNLFLTRDRTIARKLQELFFVWYLETRFTKEELLELYLNVVEFGPSVYGITDAAAYYFGRAPGELNQLESVFLIKLLPNPVARHRAYAVGGLSERQRNVLHRVLKRMRARGRLTEAEYRASLGQTLDFYQDGEPLPPPRGPMARMRGTSSQDYIYRDEGADEPDEGVEAF